MTAHDLPLPDGGAPITPGSTPPLIRLPQWLESATGLDRVAPAIQRLGERLVGEGSLRDQLTGRSTGHALHPPLTDLPIGFWTSSFVLDWCGARYAKASRLLVAAGVVSAAPTALAGLAEWQRTPRPEQRVATVHAVANSLALLLYLRSLGKRLRDPRRGRASALLGATAATMGGFLGGHLATARKVGSRSPELADDGIGPELLRPRNVA